MSRSVAAPRPARPAAGESLAAVVVRRHLPALDGLRAIAVLVVIVYHAGYARVPGDLGVSIFFVLSGFLITRLLLGEWERTGDVSLRRFYLRRALRIFPAYYAFILLTMAADTVLGARWAPGRVAAAFGYVYNYYNAIHLGRPFDTAHAWSLSVEEQFYLLWPALFILLARRGERALRLGLLAAIAAVLAWRSWLYLGAGAGQHYVYNALDTRLDNLAVGCFLAVVATSPAAGRVTGVLARYTWAPLVTAALVLVSRKTLGGSWHYSLGFTVDAVLFGLLIAQLLRLHATRAWRWLDHPLLRWLGALSYPMYLWHVWGLAAAGHLPLPGGLPARLLAGIALTVGLAATSYYLLERPILALRERLENRLLVPAPAPARAAVPESAA